MPKPEDRKLTPKENYLRILNGEMPEWAPMYTMGMPQPTDDPIPLAWTTPLIFNDPHPFGGTDLWGVNWVAGSNAANGAILPEPNHFILEDIGDWHDVVKAPDISDVDWEDMCRKTMAANPVDRTQTALGLNLYIGTFQEFVGLMGFTEGLIAMIEEPEEVAELCKYMNDFYVEVGRQCMPYIQPDVIVMADDTCSEKSPFMSEELFRQILLPCYKHETETLAVPYGIPAQFHNCGACTHYIEICHEEAHISAWDPAQTMNDLEGFKQKWGREIAILGGFDARDELADPDCSDEVVIEGTRASFDKYAPDGGYAFYAEFIGPRDDPRVAHKNDVMWREALDYGNKFYD